MKKRYWRYLSSATKERGTDFRGFTLMELLISVAIAGLVVSGLLYLVNEVIRVDRREASLENVQRDMQRSMDYITDELREAVFVYPDPTVVTARMAANSPDFPSGGVPILAFWKPEFLSRTESSDLDSINCTTLTAPKDEQCEALKLRQSYYSLIIYFTTANAATDSNWKGQAKIVRYTLPQYRRSDFSATSLGDQTLGYNDPNNDYINWNPTSGVSDIEGDWSVLVDYVDAPGSNQGTLAADCSEFVTNAADITSATTSYQRSPDPTAASPLQSNSFVACISQPGTAAVGSNQEVVVLLRGNAKTAAQEAAVPTPSGSTISQSSLPALKSRVLVRGAANKNPE